MHCCKDSECSSQPMLAFAFGVCLYLIEIDVCGVSVHVSSGMIMCYREFVCNFFIVLRDMRKNS